METDLNVFDEYFDATFEQVIDVVKDYLDKLVELKPEAVLEVTTTEKEDKKVWKGKIVEPKKWGTLDIYYGYIEVKPTYENSLTPMHVKLYCSQPNYISYWKGLEISFSNRLNLSDGSPGPTNEPWNLIPDRGDDRQMLELWHQGYNAPDIGERLNYSSKTIHNRLSILRGKYKEKIIPYKAKWRKSSKSGNAGN